MKVYIIDWRDLCKEKTVKLPSGRAAFKVAKICGFDESDTKDITELRIHIFPEEIELLVRYTFVRLSRKITDKYDRILNELKKYLL